MTAEGTSVVRIQRVGTVLWALLVATAIVLMAIGLWRSLLVISTPQLREEARIGYVLIQSQGQPFGRP